MEAPGRKPSPRNDPHVLTELSAVAAVTAMRNGEMVAEDYARALLDRAKRLERLNAFCRLDSETVLEGARAADKKRQSGARLGALHGLPLPVKDSVNTRALLTSNGTRALATFRPRQDAAILEPLLAQGAVVMGKTNLHEWSLGWTSDSAFGAVHNPYDVTRVPGGSSGGSAVAVAARMAPLAIAADTLGSIRIPAAMCGLTGLRPTFGRYPNEGIMPLTDHKFDQVGPLARCVADVALFDSVITGDRTPLTAIPLAGIRIGIPDFFMSTLDPEVERVASDAFQRLRAAGATLVGADIPAPVKAAMPVALTIILYEFVAALSSFVEAQGTGVSFDQMLEQAGDEIRALVQGIALPSGRPAQAAYESMLIERQRIRDSTRDYFIDHDLTAIAFPPILTQPPKIGENGDVIIGGQTVERMVTIARNISLGSCASLASLILPAGTTCDGLPIGLEFDALPGDDRRLLAVGLSLEQALGAMAAPAPRL
jgi:Asp-tRNA(Asn)/Glu-tRNA(Gln) amidotransferase A subunit family amidase